MIYGMPKSKCISDILASYSHETHLIYISENSIDHKFGFFTVLNHEILHKVLHETVSSSASFKYDNISGCAEIDLEAHGGSL